MVIDSFGLHEHDEFQPGGVFTMGESVPLDSVSGIDPTPVDLNGDGNLDLLGLFFQLGDGSPPPCRALVVEEDGAFGPAKGARYWRLGVPL